MEKKNKHDFNIKSWEWIVINIFSVAIPTSTIFTMLIYITRPERILPVAVFGSVLLYVVYELIPEEIDNFRNSKTKI
jgi:xanthine/uracil permease